MFLPEGDVAVVEVVHGTLNAGDGLVHPAGVADVLPLVVCVVQDLHHEDDQQDEDETGVEVGHVEGGAESADQRVGAEERGHDEHGELVRGVLRQRLDGGFARQQHADGDYQVGQDGEEAEDLVCSRTEPCVDDLKTRQMTHRLLGLRIEDRK